MTWWTGTWLVARRILVENMRSRVYRFVTGLMLLISVAAVVVPQLINDEDTTYTLATVAEVPADVRSLLDAAAETGDFTVKFEQVDGADEVRVGIRDGDITAGLVDDSLFTDEEGDGTFPVLVAQAVVAAETVQRLQEAGLGPDEVSRIQSVQPPEQVPVGRVDDQARTGAGFAVGIVLYLALTFGGSAIANAVAMEKSTRISEVLLAVLRPSQIMVGTVVAVGLTTLSQLLILAVPVAVAVPLTDIGLPSVASGDLALAVVWFVLGFALYAFLFAASAALVDKITEASTAVLPVTMVLVIGYLLAITVVMDDPSSTWSVLISLFPFSAPLAMPIRWTSGEVPVYQLLLAMLLTAGTAVLLVIVGSSIYRRALLITGRRVKVREVLRGPATNA
ncbi:MAG: ABC transporter permease [Nocardioides sp.]